ncbi:hypothetical protein L6452_03413 [Arctium lappa]|uniref:Uncharacterized protein n=1 Tax=Arctium lappa TaxID=4217 RepID=A0ACB9FM36_ARCLA|nr:hypothetical protein L6452_03413 [Arctium lappa]
MRQLCPTNHPPAPAALHLLRYFNFNLSLHFHANWSALSITMLQRIDLEKKSVVGVGCGKNNQVVVELPHFHHLRNRRERSATNGDEF